jgi:predicted nucleotidyltransferase
MTPISENRFRRLLELQKKLRCEWRAINKAIGASEQQVQQLQTALLGSDSRPLAEDSSIVFFGSLARGEWTSQSDPDWVLLIDGQVDEQHFLALRHIEKKLRELGENEPGTTRTFGELAFSHELVHRIGGIDDTNRNLTLRMLLLLESISIGSDLVRQRVLQAVLYRYLADDPSWTWRSDAELPRFLLNDVVRFWRTMAVDFADKFHDQEGEKWALRNAKLRFSRKLLFLVGILACFSWKLHPRSELADNPESATDVAIRHFDRYLARPPLEILADELLLANAPEKLCQELFSTYDEFIAILDDEELRRELHKLPRDIAEKSDLFQRVRGLSHRFQASLTEWLFQPDTPIFDLVKKYGLF